MLKLAERFSLFAISILPFVANGDGLESGTMVRLVDGDGTKVTLRLVGPGSGIVSNTTDGFSIYLEGTSSESRLTMTASGGVDRIAVASDIRIDGDIGAILGAGIRLTGLLSSPGRLGPTTLLAVSNGLVAAPRIAAVRIIGDVIDSMILAGTDLGNDHQFGGNGPASDHTVDGTLEGLRVGGSVRNSIIAAGFDILTRSLMPPSGGGINSVDVRRQANDGAYFVANRLPTTFKVSGRTQTPTDSIAMVALERIAALFQTSTASSDMPVMDLNGPVISVTGYPSFVGNSQRPDAVLLLRNAGNANVDMPFQISASDAFRMSLSQTSGVVRSVNGVQFGRYIGITIDRSSLDFGDHIGTLVVASPDAEQKTNVVAIHFRLEQPTYSGMITGRIAYTFLDRRRVNAPVTGFATLAISKNGKLVSGQLEISKSNEDPADPFAGVSELNGTPRTFHAQSGLIPFQGSFNGLVLAGRWNIEASAASFAFGPVIASGTYRFCFNPKN